MGYSFQREDIDLRRVTNFRDEHGLTSWISKPDYSSTKQVNQSCGANTQQLTRYVFQGMSTDVLYQYMFDSMKRIDIHKAVPKTSEHRKYNFLGQSVPTQIFGTHRIQPQGNLLTSLSLIFFILIIEQKMRRWILLPLTCPQLGVSMILCQTEHTYHIVSVSRHHPVTITQLKSVNPHDLIAINSRQTNIRPVTIYPADLPN